MRILLIQAVSTLDCREVVFPLGLARLASSLAGLHEVLGLDLNLNPFPWPGLVRALDEFKPELLAVSFRNLDPLAGNLFSFVPHLKTLMALIKEHSPEARVVLGGSAFTLFAKRLMQEATEVDFGLSGEGEVAFPRLVANLDGPWTVPGVFWRRDDGSLQENGAATCCEQLDVLPFPDWRIFDPNRYLHLNHYVAFMGVETKRGCPNNCRYCLYPTLQGSRLRLRSPVRVVDELEALHNTYHIKLVHFTDPVVNQPAEHLRSICREILKRRLEIGWTGFFREDTLTHKDMELYRRSGLVTWYFSADGASKHSLRLLGKDLSRDQILHAARIAAESGVLAVYHFLVNLPGETQRSIHETRDLLAMLFEIHASKGNLGAVVINNLRLYPGTPLTQFILLEGLMDPRQDLLYPTYYNPPPWDHLRYELTACCMKQSTVSYLTNSSSQP